MHLAALCFLRNRVISDSTQACGCELRVRSSWVQKGKSCAVVESVVLQSAVTVPCKAGTAGMPARRQNLFFGCCRFDGPGSAGFESLAILDLGVGALVFRV